MGHKVNPISYRIGVLRGWSSKWFAPKKKYREYLAKDLKLRKYLTKKLKSAAVAAIDIERSPQVITFRIFSSRPGIIIGRGGAGIEELKKDLVKMIDEKVRINIDIQEVKNPEANAALVGYLIAEQIEKRIGFRRVLKKTIDRVMGTPGVQGVKLMIGGRLDGAEMSRTEWLGKGRMPLQTLRSDIDYAKANAYTTYGVVGIKVWINKGEVFEEKENKSSFNKLNLAK